MNTMTTTVPTPSPAMRSPWHSPIPYLFGGLAAMLGLIVFALLILACSYWRLSGRLGHDSNDRDLEHGGADSEEKPKVRMQFEEKIVVIMAGQDTPMFLATPVSSRGSSFKSSCSGGKFAGKVDGEGEERKKEEEGSRDQVQLGSLERHEASS